MVRAQRLAAAVDAVYGRTTRVYDRVGVLDGKESLACLFRSNLFCSLMSVDKERRSIAGVSKGETQYNVRGAYGSRWHWCVVPM